MNISTARVYDAAPKPGEFRVLVDRLWPRGVSKERAALDLWAKDIAPSPDLRTWFGHKPERFKEFSVRYTAELRTNPALPAFLDEIKKHAHVTLLYGAKDPAVNHAVVLLRFLRARL